MRTPFYRRPALWWALGLIVWLIFLATLYWEDALAFYDFMVLARVLPEVLLQFGPPFWSGIRAIINLAFPIVASYFLWRWFFWLVSQFVLPVTTAEEREQVRHHFADYAFGQPGPAIFVRNGQLVASLKEKERRQKSKGVILVDSVSGVVLRTDTRFTRAHGPGVVFTREGEYIAEALDLRQQERYARAIKAFTRDGILVTVDIHVTFVLDSGERNPLRTWQSPNAAPFGFNAENAYRAVYGRAYRDHVSSEWAELPALIAADIWRELLMQRDFESLFRLEDPAFALLDDLQYQIEQRMIPVSMDGRSREQQVLSERGLRVLSVQLLNLELPAEVEQKRMLQLKEVWKTQTKRAVSDPHPSIQQARGEGRQAGQVEMLNTLTAPLRRKLAAGEEPPHPEAACDLTEAARQLLNDNARTFLRDSNITEQVLNELRKALVDLDIQCRKAADQGTFWRPT